MTNTRRDGIYMLLLGCVVFIALGFAMGRNASAPMLDFRALYYPSRCLIRHGDPYNESQVARLYAQEGVYAASDTDKERQMTSRFVYPPTTFLFTVPFATLPWETAQLLWSAITAASLILASFLIWSFGADCAPVVSGCLIGFLLANCELFLMQGMCAGIAIGLCAIAVWCFFRNRHVVMGIFCLAISLAVKPQDTGIVWLYLLLAGGVFRKRAIQTLLAWAALSLPLFVWVSLVAPNWLVELRSNIGAFSVRGGINDPSLASAGAHGLSRIVSLQSILSTVSDKPGFYNFASVILVAPLFVIWVYATVRRPLSAEKAWTAIAAIAPLSMLPIYHRQYDATLILLTIPACALLIAKGGTVGRLALAVSAAGVVVTGELPWVVYLTLINRIHIQTTWIPQNVLRMVLTGIEVFTTPLTILGMGIFYLTVYVRRGNVRNEQGMAKPQ